MGSTPFIFSDGTEMLQILFLTVGPRIGSALCYFNKRPESTSLTSQEDSTGFRFAVGWLPVGSVVTQWLLHSFLQESTLEEVVVLTARGASTART